MRLPVVVLVAFGLGACSSSNPGSGGFVHTGGTTGSSSGGATGSGGTTSTGGATGTGGGSSTGGTTSTGGATGTGSYHYEFTFNGCDTGKHTFSSLEAMCAGLESASLNGGCALAARQQFFGDECTGTFQETN